MHRRGKDLNVDAVLLGRVIPARGYLTIKLIWLALPRGPELWGEQYNRKVADLLAFQEDFSNEIYNNLRPKLTGQKPID